MPDIANGIFVYFDTNLWFGYLRANASEYEKCEKLFDDVIAGRKILLTSYFAMLEFLDALKRNIAKRYECNEYSESYVHDKIQRYAEDFLKMVEELASKGHLYFIECEEYVEAYHYDIWGKIRNSECVITQNKRTGKYKYADMGLRDIEHIYHALYGGAVEFYTGDEDLVKSAQKFGFEIDIKGID